MRTSFPQQCRPCHTCGLWVARQGMVPAGVGADARPAAFGPSWIQTDGAQESALCCPVWTSCADVAQWMLLHPPHSLRPQDGSGPRFPGWAGDPEHSSSPGPARASSGPPVDPILGKWWSAERGQDSCGGTARDGWSSGRSPVGWQALLSRETPLSFQKVCQARVSSAGEDVMLWSREPRWRFDSCSGVSCSEGEGPGL